MFWLLNCSNPKRSDTAKDTCSNLFHNPQPLYYRVSEEHQVTLGDSRHKFQWFARWRSFCWLAHKLPAGKPQDFIRLSFWSELFSAKPCQRKPKFYRIITPVWFALAGICYRFLLPVFFSFPSSSQEAFFSVTLSRSRFSFPNFPFQVGRFLFWVFCI